MFLGGAMQVANLGLNVVSAVQGNLDAKNAARAARQANIRNEFLTDKEQLKQFNSTGTDTNIFAKGGRFIKGSTLYGKTPNTPGGLAKVSGNIYKAVGAKHEGGGVNISHNVEVEGGEYLKFSGNDVKVISDRDINGIIPADEFEGKVGSKGVGAAFDDEYSKQESMKNGKLAKTKMFLGGKKQINPDVIDKEDININVDKPLGGFGQQLDNVGNAILTLAKPKVPAPIYAKPISINTEQNINPELANVQREAANLRSGIRGNFANPITTSALESKISTNELMQKNDLLGKKTAAETQLGNQQAAMNAQIQQGNQGLANQYNQQVAGRTQEQFGELSANLGNLQDDAAHKENISKLTDFQDKQLYISLLTDPEGKNTNMINSGLFDTVFAKLSKADFDKLTLNPRAKEAIYSRLK